MAIQPRLIALAMAAASLISVALLLQHRAADANRQQQSDLVAQSKQPASQAGKSDTADNESAENIFFDLGKFLTSTRQAEDEIRKALRKPIRVEFKETPLKDAVEFIGNSCSIQTQINTTAIKEESIAVDEPITFSRTKPLPADTVLRSMLQPLGLTYLVDDETLTVTTAVEHEGKLQTRLYDVKELIHNGISAAAVARVIESESSGSFMNLESYGGEVSVYAHLLSIRTTEKVHAEIQVILSVLGKIAASPRKSGTAPLQMTADDRKVYKSLSSRVDMEFQKTPLKEVVAFLDTLIGVNVTLDESSLLEERIDTNEPVTFRAKQVTLRTALKRLLEPLGLTHFIEDGALVITTEIGCEEKLDSFVFVLRDFAEANYSMEMIIEYIQQEASGPWLEFDGTGGFVLNDISPGLIIIRHTWKNLEEAAFHIEELRSMFKRESPDGKLPQLPGDSDGLKMKFYHITSSPVEEVADAIRKLVAVDTWKSAGGNGKLAIIESRIIIRQSSAVHQQIEKFLQSIGAGTSTDEFGLGSRNGPIGSGFFCVD